MTEFQQPTQIGSDVARQKPSSASDGLVESGKPHAGCYHRRESPDDADVLNKKLRCTSAFAHALPPQAHAAGAQAHDALCHRSRERETEKRAGKRKTRAARDQTVKPFAEI
eukprot:6212365-Pleurochrysis_carterae.AAC.1